MAATRAYTVLPDDAQVTFLAITSSSGVAVGSLVGSANSPSAIAQHGLATSAKAHGFGAAASVAYIPEGCDPANGPEAYVAKRPSAGAAISCVNLAEHTINIVVT